MKRSSLIVILFFLIIGLSNNSYSQEWIKTFSSNTYQTFSYQLKEDYDKGVIIGGNLSLGSVMKIGWIIKTDINGNIIWEKKLGNGTRMWALDGIDKTPNGGFIIAGVCDTLDNDWWDPFITKLTSCGEVEWCHIFHTDSNPDYGVQINSLPDNTYVFLLKDWDVNPRNSVWLMHLDEYGEIIWKQRYFQNDTLASPLNETDLQVIADGKYLVTGTCYRPISGQSQPNWIWPMMILADSTGEAMWEISWGCTIPFTEQVGGEGFQSVETDHAIYSCISHYHWPVTSYSPTLIKTSLMGEPVSYKDLIPNTIYGKATTINTLFDTTFILGTGYTKSDNNPKLAILKTDTLGTILKEKVLKNTIYLPIDAILTQDNKYLITAADFTNNKYLFHLWKLNENLDFDSIYMAPRVYDSLCPYPIVSSTLSMPPCGLTVGKEELPADEELVKMKVFPNPASDWIHITLPDRIRLESQTKNFSVQTTFHKWTKELDLEVYDLFGKRVFSKEISRDDKQLDLDVSAWPQGMYVVRLVYDGKTVASEKIIIKEP
ncbi:MAG: T9SS type A sorting domain-containing protein [Bacteroidales bacterium]|nr:T9SS type A sorting domain-containing protein [Bacteroidales bacterium]HNW74458.1 T9SS type A sorting domain-containing protein [Bacteroidales bacterium]HPS50253.1 T9SS type A sorting domain-containing protein [Bacteroidales bacterium]